MTQKYDFPSPGKQYKKVKATRQRLINQNGEEVEHEISVYLHSAGSPTFCISLPEDYFETWKNHPDKTIVEYQASTIQKRLDMKERLVRASTFDDAVNTLVSLSENWKKFHANRTMEKRIYITLELKTPTQTIDAPSFSSSETIIGMSAGWGFEVAGKQYVAPYEFKCPIGVDVIDFNEMRSYDGRLRGKNVVIPYTDDLWLELKKIRETLHRAGDMLAKLATPDSAVSLLTSLAAGMPLLSHGSKKDGQE